MAKSRVHADISEEMSQVVQPFQPPEPIAALIRVIVVWLAIEIHERLIPILIITKA